jgi:hypothetical protein
VFVGNALGSLADTAEDRDRVRKALLAMLDSASNSYVIMMLAELLSPLVHEKEERDR